MGQFIVTFVDLTFNLFTLLIIGRVLLSWFPQYRYHPIGEMIFSLTDPIILPFQRIVPNVGMFDFSPMIAIVVLNIVQVILVTALRNFLGL